MDIDQLDRDGFERSVLEVVAWFERSAVTLRGSDLRPSSLEIEQSVAEVCAIRRALTSALPSRDVALRGRLLAYFPDDNLCDGAARVASEGLFDDDNIPPWETWVTFVHIRDVPISFRRCLIAWIPRTFVPRADAGVQVNPEECICWLDGDLDDIRDLVRRAARA